MKHDKSAAARDLVVVSGYYGFDNLGDEAILEELTGELKRLVAPDKIVVLSANPESTAATFGVRACARMSLPALVSLASRTRMFVSGGGGLFQNRRSLGSIFYYGGLIATFKALGARVVVYAQGLGPLHGNLAAWLTRQAMSRADGISLRDDTSASLMQSWSLEAVRTADPVWCLGRSPLPQALSERLANLLPKNLLPETGRAQVDGPDSPLLVGLSLRPDPYLTDAHLQALAQALARNLPAGSVLLPLALQPAQDTVVLSRFAELLAEPSGNGCRLTLLPTSDLQLPSQWLTLIGSCQLVVGMRLHALVMALASGRAVVGLAYDPKVTAVLTEFEQPTLNLVNENAVETWTSAIKLALEKRLELSERALRKSESAKDLACQNFSLLARILDLQSDC